jgi:adenylosuccinate synthase
VRIADLLRADTLRDKLRLAIRSKNEILERIYGADRIDENGTIDEFVVYGDRLRPFVTDTSVLLNNALDTGKTVLFEGAQGTLLDIDHGTYPYVTSSNTTAGGACTGSGVGPTRIDEVIGVTKAYTTRVGNGPFPTELDDENGERIRAIGHEYGATTGRSRRCGWFDAPIVRLAGRINGLTSIALTRLDVLDTLEQLRLCVGYRCDNIELSEFPSDPELLQNCEPIYEELPGWQVETTAIRRFNDLPPNARHYVDRISDLTGRPVSLISVGPERESTIDVD